MVVEAGIDLATLLALHAVRRWASAEGAATAPLLEACVRNRRGKGHHEDSTGHPCKPGTSTPKPPAVKATGKPATPAPAPAPEAPAKAPGLAARALSWLKDGGWRGSGGALVRWYHADQKGDPHAHDDHKAGAIMKVMHAIEGALEAPKKAVRALVDQAARERGFDDAQREAMMRETAIADTVAAWTVNIPLVHQGLHDAHAAELGVDLPVVGGDLGQFAAAKAGYYVPVASIAYLAYSTVRNPAATLRAAGALVKKHLGLDEEGRQLSAMRRSVGLGEAEETTALDQAAVDALADGIARTGPRLEWYRALLAAALDETHDLGRAVEVADAILGEDGEQAIAEGCVPNKKGKGHHDEDTGHPCKPGGGGPAPAKKGAKAGPAPAKKKGGTAPASRPKGEVAKSKVEAPKDAGKPSTPEEHQAAITLALTKLERAPRPTEKEVEEATAGLAAMGANRYRRGLVGNSTDRRKRRVALLTEFGDGETCPCIYCGIKVGEGSLEQDKIFTTAQGGRYRTPNLVPSCSDCNKRRSDMPFAEAMKNVVKYREQTTA